MKIYFLLSFQLIPSLKILFLFDESIHSSSPPLFLFFSFSLSPPSSSMPSGKSANGISRLSQSAWCQTFAMFMYGAGDSPAMSEGQTTTAGRISGTMYDNMALQGMYFRQVCLHFYYIKSVSYFHAAFRKHFCLSTYQICVLFVSFYTACVGIHMDFKTFYISGIVIRIN